MIAVGRMNTHTHYSFAHVLRFLETVTKSGHCWEMSISTKGWLGSPGLEVFVCTNISFLNWCHKFHFLVLRLKFFIKLLSRGPLKEITDNNTNTSHLHNSYLYTRHSPTLQPPQPPQSTDCIKSPQKPCKMGQAIDLASSLIYIRLEVNTCRFWAGFK